MSARRPKNKPLAGSGQNRWQTVLELGGQLLSSGRSASPTPQPGPLPGFPDPLEKLQRQRTLILQAAEILFAGQVSLWLADDLLPFYPPAGKAGYSFQADLSSQVDFDPQPAR